MSRRGFNWPRLVFWVVPFLIVVADAVLLVSEHIQTDTEKAIRLVKESNSRKENFTLQQYLYSTVYHRKAAGEPITIEGWRATAQVEPGAPITIEFSYSNSLDRYVAIWEANLTDRSVTPKNQTALDLSWH
jgi:hypothetical protein